MSCLFRFRIDDTKKNRAETRGMKNSFCFWGFHCWLLSTLLACHTILILGNCALQILSVLRSFRNKQKKKNAIRFLIKKWIISWRRLIQLSVRWVKQLLSNDCGWKAIFLRFYSFKWMADLNKSVNDFFPPSTNDLINYILLASANKFLANSVMKRLNILIITP